MINLILKDLYIQKKFAFLSPLLLIPYYITIGQNITGSGFSAIIIYSMSIAFIAYFMAMYTSFSTGESENNQHRLILSLPVTRHSVISAKYIVVIVWWLISYISSTLILFILDTIVDMNINSLLNVKVLVLSLCFTYILMSIFYPLNFRFGFRVASSIGIVSFFLLTSGIGKIFTLDLSIITTIMNKPIGSFSIITLFFVVTSYVLTVNSFSKRDF